METKEKYESSITAENYFITLTHYGYIKRQAIDICNRKIFLDKTRSSEDYIENFLISAESDYICFFTNLGKVYRIKSYEIPEYKRVANGIRIVKLLPFSQDEKVTAMIKTNDSNNNEKKYLTIITKRGIVKRTELSEYRNANNKGINAISLNENDEPKYICITGGDNELIAATKNGMVIRFDECNIKVIGRTGHGVKAIDLLDDDEVIGMEIVDNDKKLLTVSEKGKGRRSEFNEYPIHHIGGKGMQNYKTGNVTGIKTVHDDDEIIVISSDGKITHVYVNKISIQSRYAIGTYIMRVAEGNRIVNLVTI